MEWIDATKELPPVWYEKQWLKIRWNLNRVGIIKTTGFWNHERKVFMTNQGEFKKQYVQWLKEDEQ